MRSRPPSHHGLDARSASGHVYVLQREQWLARPIEEVFAFFGSPHNLESITPAWLRFSVVTPTPIVMGAGTLIDYRLRWRGVPLRWTTLIEEWEPPHRFVDVQLRGPYRLWHHTHTFRAVRGGTRLYDTVRYRLPLGWLGAAVHRVSTRRDLDAIFDFRTQRVRDLLDPGPGSGGTAGTDPHPADTSESADRDLHAGGARRSPDPAPRTRPDSST
jgi:ligand-binding SRPBCC domain-containing protein